MEDPPDTTTEGPCFFSLFSFTIAVITEKATGFFFFLLKRKGGQHNTTTFFPAGVGRVIPKAINERRPTG